MPFASKIIERHGGSVSLENRVNEGTLIKITLPVEGGSTSTAQPFTAG
jgi:signal transduction histidine kinase